MSNEKEDETDYLHTRLEAGSAKELQEQIELQQKDGYELINVVFDGANWNAFMKYSLIDCSFKILNELETLNTGVGMLINNDPNFVTSGRLSELQSVLESILTVLERGD